MASMQLACALLCGTIACSKAHAFMTVAGGFSACFGAASARTPRPERIHVGLHTTGARYSASVRMIQSVHTTHPRHVLGPSPYWSATCARHGHAASNKTNQFKTRAVNTPPISSAAHGTAHGTRRPRPHPDDAPEATPGPRTTSAATVGTGPVWTADR